MRAEQVGSHIQDQVIKPKKEVPPPKEGAKPRWVTRFPDGKVFPSMHMVACVVERCVAAAHVGAA